VDGKEAEFYKNFSDINDLEILQCVFPNKNDGNNNKTILCNMWENKAPGTEFPRIFCAGIGPLQLGIVLVYLYFL